MEEFGYLNLELVMALVPLFTAQILNVVNCPVEALLRYLKVRPSSAGPLFVTEDKSISRAKITKILKASILICGLEPEFYNTLSFSGDF